jgi:uroporphyrinogen decarboxylase
MKDPIHRQRVAKALEHKEPDRSPLTLGSPSCSIHKVAHKRLLDNLGYNTNDAPIITDNILQIVDTDVRILELFDIDLLWLLPKVESVIWNEARTSYIDPFGREFYVGGGFFNQTDFPLKDHDLGTLSEFAFPVLTTSRFQHLGAKSEFLFSKGYGIGIDGPWGLYEISSSLVGTTKYLMDLILDPLFAQRIAERVLEEYLIPFYDHLLADTASRVQVVGISDDLGSQTGLIFSPRLYQKIFKPLHKRLIDHIHKQTSAKVYMHSDGSIFPIIPDLIEIGVEGLNPVQYTAKDMGLQKLVSEFGKDLGFFGGVVENEVLSYSNPQEIRDLVRNNVTILKNDFGFIFAPIHNISQEVPPENIIALYEAGQQYCRYS